MSTDSSVSHTVTVNIHLNAPSYRAGKLKSIELISRKYSKENKNTTLYRHSRIQCDPGKWCDYVISMGFLELSVVYWWEDNSHYHWLIFPKCIESKFPWLSCSYLWLIILGIGNPRGNENPFLLTFGIFWYRFHNHVANRISSLLWDAYRDPDVQKNFDFEEGYTKEEFMRHYDEIIFNEARKWVIATHQVRWSNAHLKYRDNLHHS